MDSNPTATQCQVESKGGQEEEPRGDDARGHEVRQQIEAAKAKLPLPALVRNVVGDVELKKLYCPFHFFESPSVAVRQTEGGHWWWRCSAGCAGGEEVAFVAHWNDLTIEKATKEYLRLASEVGKPKNTIQDALEETAYEEPEDEQEHDPFAIQRAKKYVSKMPAAVAYAGGHNQLYAVVCALAQKFNLSLEDDWEVLLEYNWRCQPPWSKGELIHKLVDAYKTIDVELSEVELNNKLEFPDGYVPNCTAGCLSPRKPASARRDDQRPLPVLTTSWPLNENDVSTLARLRGIPADVIKFVWQQGFLFRTRWWGLECFGLRDSSGRLIELRRIDGKNFPAVPEYNLAERKSHCIKGSNKGWPLGIMEAAQSSCIALVEGWPDFIYSHRWVLEENATDRVAVVAMMSATPPIDPAALCHFAGKRVRIFPHLDPVGIKGAGRWQAQLQAAGAEHVDFFDLSNIRLPDGSLASDLCDLTQLTPEELASNPSLTSILP